VRERDKESARGGYFVFLLILRVNTHNTLKQIVELTILSNKLILTFNFHAIS
jgi:hypothetical protein